MGHQFDALSGRVIDAAIAVHRELGPGFLESIYESALRTALRHRGIVFEAQKDVTVFFESEEAGVQRLDLVVERLHVGLLMNFNAAKLIVKRVVLGFRSPP